MPENELKAWIDNILSNVHIEDVRTINDVLTRELKIDKLQRLAKRDFKACDRCFPLIQEYQLLSILSWQQETKDFQSSDGSRSGNSEGEPIEMGISKMTDLGIGENRGENKDEDKGKAPEAIKKISKEIGKVKESDFEITEEQKREIQRQEARDGKIVVKKDKDRDKEERLPTLTTYKYSKNGKGDLYESVLMAGQPCFITYNHTSLVK